MPASIPNVYQIIRKKIPCCAFLGQRNQLPWMIAGDLAHKAAIGKVISSAPRRLLSCFTIKSEILPLATKTNASFRMLSLRGRWSSSKVKKEKFAAARNDNELVAPTSARPHCSGFLQIGEMDLCTRAIIP